MCQLFARLFWTNQSDEDCFVCPQNMNLPDFYLALFNKFFLKLHVENEIDTGIYEWE